MQRLSKKIAHLYLALGIIFSVLIARHLYSLETEKIDEQFRRDVDQHSATIEQVLVQHYEIVHGLANALGLLAQPEPDYFIQLCETVRRRHPVIKSLSWYWQVADSGRAELEQQLQQTYQRFSIKSFSNGTYSDTSLGKSNALSTRATAKDYMPMIAIVPGKTLGTYLGLDLYSLPDIVPGLTEAARTEQIYVSGAYQSPSREELEFAVFYPVYHPFPSQQETEFAGFVSATFSIDSLLEQQMHDSLNQWAVRIEARHNPDADAKIIKTSPSQELARGAFSYQRKINVGADRYWDLHVRPGKDYIGDQRSNTPLSALLTGLAFTGLIYYLWLNQLYRTHNIELLVAKRTDELSKANKRLRELSQTDALTGVANRRLFEERLQHEFLRLRRAKKFLSLMMIDVDYFKSYNDYYGHQQGDETLERIASCIADTVNRPADLVARYGGEEFIVLLPDTDESALDLANDILDAVRQMNIPHARSRSSDRVTISIGFGFARVNLLQTPKQLVLAADQAMYFAKASGRDCIASAAADASDITPIKYPGE
jgi:diguanylate cyclase (GGDEF)-like protein